MSLKDIRNKNEKLGTLELDVKELLENKYDEDLIEIILERDKNDDGIRYTSEDVIRMRQMSKRTQEIHDRYNI